jgi:hypothetical protein
MANWYSCPSAGHEIHGQSLVIDEATGANIAVVYGDSPGDAELIAAAPAMLEALREAVARVALANEEGEPILSAWLPDARAILARIDGTPTAQPAGEG